MHKIPSKIQTKALRELFSEQFRVRGHSLRPSFGPYVVVLVPARELTEQIEKAVRPASCDLECKQMRDIRMHRRDTKEYQNHRGT